MTTRQTSEGRVVKIIEQKNQYQKLEIALDENQVIVENGKLPSVNYRSYAVNDKLLISSTVTKGRSQYFISDYVRRDGLIVLLMLFVVAVLIVARKRGLASLLGLGFSFLIIFGYILPNIVGGGDPIGVAITGALIIIPITFVLSHGFNRKTFTAILATLVALVITGVLAVFFVQFTRLTGYSSEESAFLQFRGGAPIQMQGLLLAGIIIGVLGILDDITLAQTAIVFQLKKTDPKLNFAELYQKGIEIGHDHISSMVNTLVLVYAGSSLPLLLLFINSPVPFSQVVNYEFIAEEIVRTLVSSIGLIVSVPLATFLSSYVASNQYFSD